MQKLNLCKEVLENAIGVHKTCEQCGIELEPLEMVAVQAMEELLAYRTAEEQGLILRLPIAENTEVYSIEYCCGKDKNNKSGMCHMGFCENCDDKGYYIKKGIAKQCSITEINKTVFLTREEAEKALEDMKSN